ncbi:MAG: DUF2157 domain-containing protein [Oscillospiraceae bacterium]|nr:DUF2157 domain-containing protein [Oscillospiraceae bacterium]
MDRAAILLYLRNLRDLEVAKNHIAVQRNRERQSIEQRKQELGTAHYETEPSKDSEGAQLILGALLLGFGILCVIMVIARWIEGYDDWLLVLIGGIFCIWRGGTWLSSAMDLRTEYNTVKEHNAAEETRLLNNQPIIAKLTNDWRNKEQWYNGEYSKVQQLLNEFYRMNILASQYRNLAAVCYIYDYMSTSQASLEDTLIHEHMENGIRRLEEKLDSIIVRLEDVVYETRCVRQNSQRSIDQNNQMLDSLRRAEQNTFQASQYAQLSANYSRANAYFSLANYLKR